MPSDSSIVYKVLFGLGSLDVLRVSHIARYSLFTRVQRDTVTGKFSKPQKELSPDKSQDKTHSCHFHIKIAMNKILKMLLLKQKIFLKIFLSLVTVTCRYSSENS